MSLGDVEGEMDPGSSSSFKHYRGFVPVFEDSSGSLEGAIKLLETADQFACDND